MDARRLKQWKEQQTNDARTIAKRIRPTRPDDLARFYSSFTLDGQHTTALDPYTKVWELLPYFSKIIVGITPYLKTEDDFISWYGVSPRELLHLREQGRVELRILYPRATNTTPHYLNVFFDERLPSTALDLAFDEAIAGEDTFKEAQERYEAITRQGRRSRSIDTFPDHTQRAFATGQTAYTQLRVLGFGEAADHFEGLLGQDPDRAFQWLEMCRLFLIGPVHYSLGGIHCVSSAAECICPNETDRQHEFPAELGRVLTQVAGLTSHVPGKRTVTLEDCLQHYRNSSPCPVLRRRWVSATLGGWRRHTSRGGAIGWRAS